jgi:YHS domain-containing protein
MKATVFCAAVIVAWMMVGAALAGEEQATAPAGTNQTAVAKAQTTCPVMEGERINKKIYTDYKGKRIYFCCRACPKLFAKDPDKYMKKMQDAGITPEDAPKKEAQAAEKAAPAGATK